MEELTPHSQAAAQEHKVNRQALEHDDEVAIGWRREYLYRNRLGLTASDFNLLTQAPPLAPGVVAPAVVVAWRNYIKQVFNQGFMFRLSMFPAATIYISEKQDPGRQGGQRL